MPSIKEVLLDESIFVKLNNPFENLEPECGLM